MNKYDIWLWRFSAYPTLIHIHSCGAVHCLLIINSSAGKTVLFVAEEGKKPDNSVYRKNTCVVLLMCKRKEE